MGLFGYSCYCLFPIWWFQRCVIQTSTYPYHRSTGCCGVNGNTVDQLLEHFVSIVSKQLSVYVGTYHHQLYYHGTSGKPFAMGQQTMASFLDGIGNGNAATQMITDCGCFSSANCVRIQAQSLDFRLFRSRFTMPAILTMEWWSCQPWRLFWFGVIIWIQRSFNKELIEKD